MREKGSGLLALPADKQSLVPTPSYPGLSLRACHDSKTAFWIKCSVIPVPTSSLLDSIPVVCSFPFSLSLSHTHTDPEVSEKYLQSTPSQPFSTTSQKGLWRVQSSAAQRGKAIKAARTQTEERSFQHTVGYHLWALSSRGKWSGADSHDIGLTLKSLAPLLSWGGIS